MQILRTFFWVLILVILLVFTAFNWELVEVKLWENMIVETKVPALVIIAFLIGLIPAWLLHRGTKWRLERRISQLESAARTTAASRAVPAPETPAPETPVADTSPTSTTDDVEAAHRDPAATPVRPDLENPVDPVPRDRS